MRRRNLNLNQTISVTVDRGGKSLQLGAACARGRRRATIRPQRAGMLPEYLPGPIGVQMVQPDSPADKAGLRAGDAIFTVDGHAVPYGSIAAGLHAGRTRQAGFAAASCATEPCCRPLKLTRQARIRDGSSAFKLSPLPSASNRCPSARRGSNPLSFCKDNSILIVEVLKRLFTHKVSVSQLSGPVGIARMAGQAAEMKGWYAQVRPGRRDQPQPRHPQPAAVPHPRRRHDPASAHRERACATTSASTSRSASTRRPLWCWWSSSSSSSSTT